MLHGTAYLDTHTHTHFFFYFSNIEGCACGRLDAFSFPTTTQTLEFKEERVAYNRRTSLCLSVPSDSWHFLKTNLFHINIHIYIQIFSFFLSHHVFNQITVIKAIIRSISITGTAFVNRIIIWHLVRTGVSKYHCICLPKPTKFNIMFGPDN